MADWAALCGKSRQRALSFRYTRSTPLPVPSGTVRDIVLKINAEVTRIAETPEMRARIIELGFQPVAMSVSDAENFLRADVERWAKVIRDAGIKAD